MVDMEKLKNQVKKLHGFYPWEDKKEWVGSNVITRKEILSGGFFIELQKIVNYQIANAPHFTEISIRVNKSDGVFVRFRYKKQLAGKYMKKQRND